MKKTKTQYAIPFIKDKELFKAVNFALHMIRNNEDPRLANYKASKFYNVDISDVAHYVGKKANFIKNYKGSKYDKRRNNE